MNTSTIAGSAQHDACLRKAGFLAIHVYNNPANTVAAAIRDEYNQTNARWTNEWEIGLSATATDGAGKQGEAAANPAANGPAAPAAAVPSATVAADSGFFCRFYSPKNPAGLGDDDICPPVLAFRGSEQRPEEFRDLAVNISIKIDIIARPGPITGLILNEKTVVRVLVNIRLHPFDDWEDIYNVMARGEDPADPEWLAKVMDGAVYEVLWMPSPGQGSPQVTAAENAPSFPGARSQDLVVSSQENLLRSGNPYDTFVKHDMKIKVLYAQNGDWAANIWQGMGHVGRQYTKVKDAVDRAAPIAKDKWNNRLNITGHSLGGGLAAAASLYAAKAYPELKLGAITYNAAGLHENTANRMQGSNTSDAIGIPVLGKVVQDEILHTLGVAKKMPFVSDVFRWQGKFMPPPTGQTDIRRGISPGAFPVGGDPSHQNTAYPDGSFLPFIFPLERQTMFEDPPRLVISPGGPHTVGSGSNAGWTPAGMERSILDEIAEGPAEPHMGGVQRLERGATGSEKFPHLAHLAGVARSSSTFDAFATQAVIYLMNTAESYVDAHHNFWNYVTDLKFPYDFYRGVRQLVDEIMTEGGMLGGLFAASGMFHPMDVGGSTFLRD